MTGFEVSPKLSIEESVLAGLVERAEADDVALRVGVVLESNGAVLLLERDDRLTFRNRLHLPGTILQPGESLVAAVGRGVAEETGLLVVEITRYLGSFDYLSAAGKPVRREHFAARVAEFGPVRLSNYSGYRWVPLAGELPVTSSIRQILDGYRG
ncbi:NUDIX hydrolase [Nocardia stercoris]|uniref:NUDIX hydrolase n=1 Tax=Nocardia stercoris TaxID=2483361 RepID=UPI00131A2F42|nr:NUDIX domain-containing protein [Nocardia stercoris]